MHYLVGTPKGRLTRLEKQLLDKPWQEARPGVEVKLLAEDGELYVFAQSADRIAKERAMRRRQLKWLWKRLDELAAELHQPFFARDFHGGDLLEPLPQPFQLPPPHRAFLADPIGALGEDVEFAVLSQKLDLDALPRVLPGFFQQVLLQPVQASLRRSHQILHWRIAVAHLGQHGLGRHATIHHPDPPRLAVLQLDPLRNIRSVLLSAVLPGSTS